MIDKSEALRAYQITEEQYDELLADFVAQAAGTIAAIEASTLRGDPKAAAPAVHSLKGVAGNLRLTGCFTIAQGIEAALRGNDRAAIDAGIARMKTAIEEIRASMGG
jgi:HPt (histidine-containing phosphotransfer) domain-containing protein